MWLEAESQNYNPHASAIVAEKVGDRYSEGYHCCGPYLATCGGVPCYQLVLQNCQPSDEHVVVATGSDI